MTSCMTREGARADSLHRCMRCTEGRCRKSARSATAASQAASNVSKLMRVNSRPTKPQGKSSQEGAEMPPGTAGVLQPVTGYPLQP